MLLTYCLCINIADVTTDPSFASYIQHSHITAVLEFYENIINAYIYEIY